MLYWHSDRTKAQGTKSISVVPANTAAFHKLKTSSLSLKFVLVNNTARDYTVPMSVKPSQRQAVTEPLGELLTIPEHPVLVPAFGSAQIGLTVDYSCLYNPDQGDHGTLGEQGCFATRLLLLCRGAEMKMRRASTPF